MQLQDLLVLSEGVTRHARDVVTFGQGQQIFKIIGIVLVCELELLEATLGVVLVPGLMPREGELTRPAEAQVEGPLFAAAPAPVGDAVRADDWLSVAKRELDTRPDTFTPDERGQLIAAWQSMGRMAGVGAYGQPWFAGAPSER